MACDEPRRRRWNGHVERLGTPGAGWHCLQCEYDLRGHVGDPITCPECGFVNELGELKAAARLTDKDIAPFETAPTMAIVWFWLFSLGFYFLTCGWWVAGAIFCVPTAMAWIAAVRQFRERLRGEPGIWDALLWFHFTAGWSYWEWVYWSSSAFRLAASALVG